MDGWETVCAVKFTCYTQSLPDILSSFFANFRSFVVHLLLFWQPFSLRNLIFFFLSTGKYYDVRHGKVSDPQRPTDGGGIVATLYDGSTYSNSIRTQSCLDISSLIHPIRRVSSSTKPSSLGRNSINPLLFQCNAPSTMRVSSYPTLCICIAIFVNEYKSPRQQQQSFFLKIRFALNNRKNEAINDCTVETPS